MSTPVFYHSDMPGFPAGVTTIAGGAIAVLDACLVTGANLTSVTGITQAAGVATATTTSNHNFNAGDRVQVSGATPAAYNGLHKVTAKTSTTFAFAVDAATASPATGTMEAKHPGAGWAKTFTDTNVAAYRSATSNGGMGHYLQVEDNNPFSDSFASFRLRAAIGHTALDAATRLLPARRFVRLAGAAYQTRWWVVADDRTAYVYFCGDGDNAYTANRQMMVFGELAPVSAADDGAWVVQGSSAASAASSAVFQPLVRQLAADPTSALLQALKTGAGVDAPAHLMASVMGFVGSDSYLLNIPQALQAQPNPFSGQVDLMPILAAEAMDANTGAARTATRGTFRGVYQPYGLFGTPLFGVNHTLTLLGLDVGGGTKDLVVARANSNSNTFNCQLAFDLTGPWG